MTVGVERAVSEWLLVLNALIGTECPCDGYSAEFTDAPDRPGEELVQSEWGMFRQCGYGTLGSEKSVPRVGVERGSEPLLLCLASTFPGWQASGKSAHHYCIVDAVDFALDEAYERFNWHFGKKGQECTFTVYFHSSHITDTLEWRHPALDHSEFSLQAQQQHVAKRELSQRLSSEVSTLHSKQQLCLQPQKGQSTSPCGHPVIRPQTSQIRSENQRTQAVPASTPTSKQAVTSRDNQHRPAAAGSSRDKKQAESTDSAQQQVVVAGVAEISIGQCQLMVGGITWH
ncbi:hypothetical protein H920_11261 [Fukomys damarensis]|uniref:Uncharacterized protein n=1 Tax=Fukomys damarensis TaxID=885580 RepID=A0A091D5I5_FUKDA|nr:hypothetical protein H920_11261 [Fukomys damarensis]